jgi:hypothetical protein
LGIALSPPQGHYTRLAGRSGLAYHNGTFIDGGVIDADYTGKIHILLFNLSDKKVYIKKGDRIVQLIFESHGLPDFIETSFLKPTKRGYGSYGSTGGLSCAYKTIYVPFPTTQTYCMDIDDKDDEGDDTYTSAQEDHKRPALNADRKHG